MPKANGTNGSENTEGAAVTAPVETPKDPTLGTKENPILESSDVLPTEEAKKLPLRDALEVAMIATRDAEGKSADESKDKPLGKGAMAPAKSAQAAVDTGAAGRKRDETGKFQKGYEAPAEWSAEEKADFAALSPKQQEAHLRLYGTRKKAFDDFRREQEQHKREIDQQKKEIEPYVRISQDIVPFIKAIGMDLPPQVAIQRALRAYNELETDDSRIAAAKFLRAKKQDKLADYLEAQARGDGAGASSAAIDEKIKPLQDELSSVKNLLAREHQSKAVSFIREGWEAFGATKNAAGGLRFPDIIGNDDAASKLASKIGSLVRAAHDPENASASSREFVANVLDRFPGAPYGKILEEAYRFYGGRVADQAAEEPKPQNTQQHIRKSNRAAASVPGSGISGSDTGRVKKYKSVRDAAAAAIAQLREAEGG